MTHTELWAEVNFRQWLIDTGAMENWLLCRKLSYYDPRRPFCDWQHGPHIDSLPTQRPPPERTCGALSF